MPAPAATITRRDPAMATLRLSQEAAKIAALVDAGSCALLAASEQQLDDDNAGTAERRLALLSLHEAHHRIGELIATLEGE